MIRSPSVSPAVLEVRSRWSIRPEASYASVLARHRAGELFHARALQGWLELIEDGFLGSSIEVSGRLRAAHRSGEERPGPRFRFRGAITLVRADGALRFEGQLRAGDRLDEAVFHLYLGRFYSSAGAEHLEVAGEGSVPLGRREAGVAARLLVVRPRPVS